MAALDDDETLARRLQLEELRAAGIYIADPRRDEAFLNFHGAGDSSHANAGSAYFAADAAYPAAAAADRNSDAGSHNGAAGVGPFNYHMDRVSGQVWMPSLGLEPGMSLRTRTQVIIYCLWGLAQMIMVIVALAAEWHDDCDKPLKWFLLLVSARHLYNIPLAIKRHRLGYYPLADFRIARYLQNFTLFAFIWGQTLYYNSDTCRDVAPLIYRVSWILLLVFYIQIGLPLALFLLCCLTVPCLMWAARRGYLSRFLPPEQARELENNQGASAEAIAQLPTRIFRAVTSQPQPQEHRQQEQALLRSGSQESNDGTGAEMARQDAEVRIDVQQDAPACAICYEELKDGDVLRSLPCMHDFHAACVDEWLIRKRTCPLCRKSIYERSTAPSVPGAAANSNNGNVGGRGGHRAAYVRLADEQ